MYILIHRQPIVPATSNPTPAGTTPEQLAQLRGIVSSMTGFTSEDGIRIFSIRLHHS